MNKNENFTGRLSLAFELDLEEADLDFIVENLSRLVDERTQSFLSVIGLTTVVEKYPTVR